MEAEISSKFSLTWKAKIILPSIAEQHGKGYLVAGSEVFRLEQEVWNLGESPLCGSIGAFEYDVFVFENVGERPHLIEVHMGHYIPTELPPFGYPLFSWSAAADGCPSKGVSISCRRAVIMLVSFTRSSNTVFCSRKNEFSSSRWSM